MLFFPLYWVEKKVGGSTFILEPPRIGFAAFADLPKLIGPRKTSSSLQCPIVEASARASWACSTVKEAGFCRGGNSLNVAINGAVTACAARTTKSLFMNQS